MPISQSAFGYSSPGLSGVTPYINIQDVKANGTGGGNFTSGAWRTRDLNTIVVDTHGLATLASNQITLPAGTYRCFILAPGFNVNDHVVRLRDITNGVTIAEGIEGRSNATSTHDKSELRYWFRLLSATVLEVQHQCETTNATDGFGRASNFTTDFEHYTVAEFWKLT